MDQASTLALISILFNMLRDLAVLLLAWTAHKRISALEKQLQYMTECSEPHSVSVVGTIERPSSVVESIKHVFSPPDEASKDRPKWDDEDER